MRKIVFNSSHLKAQIFVLMLCSILGAFQSTAYADTIVNFVPADEIYHGHGIIGYVIADEGGGEITTFILANSDAIVSSTRSIGCVKYDASTESAELSLLLTENNTAQFVLDGDVVAEISPDGSGGWNHWGTETLHDNEAFDALMVVTLDSNLQTLAQSNCSSGYWECVGKILACEGYSIACGLALVAIPEVCAGPCAGTMGAGCLFCLAGCIDLTLNYPCKKAHDCWGQASDMGCLPW